MSLQQQNLQLKGYEYNSSRINAVLFASLITALLVWFVDGLSKSLLMLGYGACSTDISCDLWLYR